MKYIFFCLVAISAFSLGFTVPAPEQDARKSFIDNCIRDATDGETNKDFKKMMNEFCYCAADKVFEKYSEEEVAALQAGNEDEMSAKLEPLVKPCMDELTKKVSEMSE